MKKIHFLKIVVLFVSLWIGLPSMAAEQGMNSFESLENSAENQGEFVACVSSKEECDRVARERGFHRSYVVEDHERCHPKPYACYGEH